MQNSSIVSVTLLAFAIATPSTLRADYTYQETTQLTGGSMLGMIKMADALSSAARKAGDPVVSTIYIQGNRMARSSADTVEIINLDAETVTNIDLLKHTYTVMTFQQMRDQLAKAQQQLAAQQPAKPDPTPTQPSDVKMSFDVKVRNTAAEKQVSGLNATEAILTMQMIATDQHTQQSGAMAITNDMWLVPEVPGYNQVNDFYARMADKMGSITAAIRPDISQMLAQNPGATDALADMGKEMQKIQGVPIQQIMRMGTTTNGQALPAASEAPLPPSNSPAMPSAGDIAKQSAASAITSRLPFGGFGHKKQPDPPPPAATPDTPTSAVLMETQTTVSAFSSDPVDPSHFNVPAGFKQVQLSTN